MLTPDSMISLGYKDLGEEDGARPADPALIASDEAQGLRPTGFDPSREVFGIECEHHYGITTHPLPTDGDAAKEVYRLIREAWHAPRENGGGLSDDDHDWSVTYAENPEWWSRVNIIKNAKSPPFAFKPWWVRDGAGAPWFETKFRLATRKLLDGKLAECRKLAEQYREEALREKPTKIGTKRAQKAMDRALMFEREAELIASRWPEYCGRPRTEWQGHLHRHRDPLRDSDEHPQDENAKRLSGEAVPARPEGIAQPSSAQPQSPSPDPQ